MISDNENYQDFKVSRYFMYSNDFLLELAMSDFHII